jgi:ribonuclease HII
MLICGIDEAGRGPIAGSLYVTGVILQKEIDGVNDSKKLSEKRREALFSEIIENSRFHTVITSAEEIDEIGISKAMSSSLREIMNTLEAKKYIFDGKTTFGVSNLETMVGGDGKVPEISSASIIAKVSRDREMVELSEKYPQWNFHKHKGYGTKEHIEKIKEFGYSPIHRRSFRVKALDSSFNFDE